MKITSKLNSDSACCSDLLESVFNFGNTDVDIFYALTPGKWFRIEDISNDIKRDQSTVYRSLQKLISMGFVMRDSRIIQNGGYYYEYALSVSSTLDKVIREKIDELIDRLRSLSRDLIRELESREMIQ